MKILLVALFCLLGTWLAVAQPIPGAWQTEEYFPLLKGKRVGVLANHTSTIKGKPLVDSLLRAGIQVKRIFAPEHGFQGKADAGELLENGIDQETGIPITSLYGKRKTPVKEEMQDLDWVIYDIQDVGVRFYTYISTLHYMMEACAQFNVPLLVLDRHNPNGDYTAGPVLDTAVRSFVGMHPVPIVHGCTVGEYATMIIGEGWLKNKQNFQLKIIKAKGYRHRDIWPVEGRPSPNLPNLISIRLYPSLCLFEGTNLSVGRGTEFPFQVVGGPDSAYFIDFKFKPINGVNGSQKTLHHNKICYGKNYQQTPYTYRFSLKEIALFINKSSDPNKFLNNFFDKLAGNKWLRHGLIDKIPLRDLEARYLPELDQYNKKRAKYLLYEE